MTRGGAWLLALAVACCPESAAARYHYDPADLPTGFECDTEASADECRAESEAEAYGARYGDRWDRWFFALGHDPDLFFDSHGPRDDPDDPDYRPSPEPNALLDIRYSIALRRYSGWTMAVDMLCVEFGVDCRPVLRMTRSRKFDPDDSGSQQRRKAIDAELDARGGATTEAEVAEDMQLAMEWLEADLRQCRGATAHLRRFPALKPIWRKDVLDVIDGSLKTIPLPAPDPNQEIIITTDGDSVEIRVASASPTEDRGSLHHESRSMVVSEYNSGDNYHWAKRLASIIEPCLKPATTLSPWDKYLAWHAGQGTRDDSREEEDVRRTIIRTPR